jgi:small basic protein
MTIFGKRVSEYVAFQKGILWLIVIVGLARLGFSLAGVPNSSVKLLSVTVVAILGSIYYAIRVHTTGFGSYKQLLPLLAIQSFLVNVISAAAIALAIFTAKENIFTAPEYSGGNDGKTWFHAGAHLIFATIAMSLVGWLVASAIMFITKKITGGSKGQELPKGKGRATAAGA